MDSKNKNNNKIDKKNNLIVSSEESQNLVKKRGRPKGSKNSVKTSRPERSVNKSMPADERKRILSFNLALLRLNKVDKTSVKDVSDRVNYYMSLCEQYNILPTVATFALAFGIDRRTLWTWIDNKSDVIKNPEVLDIIKTVYFSINAQYETMLTEGKIIPVSGFFMLQNNYGYKNTTDHVITTATENSDSITDITARANLMDD